MNKLYFTFLCFFSLSTGYSNEKVPNEIAEWKNSSSELISAPSTLVTSEPGHFVKTKNPYLGYVNLDYLYWTATRTGMFYEIENFVFTKNLFTGKSIAEKSKWSSGFKFEFGFSNIFDWMISDVFTYFANKFHRHEGFSPTTGVLFYNRGYILSAEKSFRLTYWTNDMDFSTLFNLSSSATLKPFISLRLAHFRYHINFAYDNFQDPTDPVLSDSFILKLPYHFFGCGPRLGFNSYYKCGNTGLNFFGGMSTSLLYGKVKFIDYIKLYSPDRLLDERNIFGSFKDLKATLQLLVGAEWKSSFDHDKKAIMLRANWEANYWWDLVDYYNGAESYMEKSLILLGVNFGIGLEF